MHSLSRIAFLFLRHRTLVQCFTLNPCNYMTMHQPMERMRLAVASFAFILALVPSAYAQNTPDLSDEEIVRLSPFMVAEDSNLGRYQAAQITSGSRVRMDLMDSTQNISVLTNEFMSDVGTGRLTDAVKYVAGIDANHNPNSRDTMNVRGFSIYGTTIDGFYQRNWINQEPAIIERIEVVKGPNSILAPQGLPGGVVNNVTKKPLFQNKGYLSYQVGRYDSNRAVVDANYVVIPDRLAFRVVGAFTDADDYGKGASHQNTTVMPMFTYRFSPSTEFTLQLQLYNANVVGDGRAPISPHTIGHGKVHRLEGVPRDFRLPSDNHQSGQHLRFFLTSQITDKLSMRLVGSGSDSPTRSRIVLTSLPRKNGQPVQVVILDDITGEWSWDGTIIDNPTFTLGGVEEEYDPRIGNLQHDFVYEHNADTWKSQTGTGYSIQQRTSHTKSRPFVSDPTEYDLTDPNFSYPGYTINQGSLRWTTTWERSQQVYLYQLLHLFEDRLVLSGSVSKNWYYGGRLNRLTSVRSSDRWKSTLPSAGFVYKFTPGISVFYGYSKQETLGTANPSRGVPTHVRPSDQNEGGIRLRLFDGKLYTTLSYFDILQDNVYTQNPLNFVNPPPVPAWPSIRSTRTSKGVEFEVSWSPNKNFSMFGSYTDFKSRDSDGMPAGVAENIAAIWASYTFDTGPLKKLQIGLGAVYTGEVAAVQSDFTTPPPGYTPVRIQPSFWYPSYVQVEGSASYRFSKNWRAQLVVKNLTNRDDSIGNMPINPKLTLRYDF